MLGLLDADILPYEFGAAKAENGDDLPLNLVLSRVHHRIEMIQERSGVDKMDFYLTSSDKSNFRFKVATILPYKGTRPVEKSKHWAAIRHELKMNYLATEIYGMEADDAVSIVQYNGIKNLKEGEEPNTAILSRDKDLNMVTGYHYGWEAGNCKEKPLWLQDRISGLRLFYKQLLTGDKVDNILGLFGVGAKSTLLTKLNEMSTEEEMASHVFKCYVDRFGAHAPQFFIENARLLWMLEYEGQLWQPPIDLQAKLQEQRVIALD